MTKTLSLSRLILYIACHVSFLPAQAQPSSASSVNRVVAAVDSFSDKMTHEHVYLQFDKPYYAIGDTIWFKAYLVDASRAASRLSSILYVEFFNDSSKLVERLALPVTFGLAWGDIPLTGDDLPQGVYGIRAYTNWMRNFGETCFFYNYFFIGQAAQNSLLVAEQHKITDAGEKQQMARISLQFSGLDKRPLRDQELRVSVFDKKKVLYKDKLTTSARGVVEVDCPLPVQISSPDIVVVAEDQQNGKRRTIIPIYLDNPERTSLQFKPEGGHLVAGLPSHIGFKATSQDGLGVEVKGVVVDSHNKKIAAFTSLHGGIGSFDMIPLAGEAYTVRVSIRGGTAMIDYPLPAVSGSGAGLHLEDDEARDSLELSVYFSPELADGSHKYILIGQSRGWACYGASLVPTKGIYLIKIPRIAFPTGIGRITLLDRDGQALGERMFFIDGRDHLQIGITTDTIAYTSRDSIALHLSVRDAAGRPVSGSFSLAVTDESQVTDDSLQRANIMTRLLLSPDLTGPVEDPGYYFQDRDPSERAALDNLILVQGLTDVDWKKIFGAPAQPDFLAEKTFAIKGKALNIFNKPVKGTKVFLMSSGRTPFIKDTMTNDQGVFVFDRFPAFDTAAFFIEARNKRGKQFNIGVEVDEVPAPALTASPGLPILPWYVNGQDRFLQYLTVNAVQLRQRDSLQYPGRGKLLQKFTVIGKKAVRDSKNLNGPGNADQVITEDQLLKEGKIDLYQLLVKDVKGFHTGVARNSRGRQIYMIRDKPVMFIFDGINLNFAMPGADFFMVKNFLESYTAEDIKGIEEMYGLQYSSLYDFRYLSGSALTNGMSFAYVEITTRAGKGPYQSRTAGTTLYRPQPFFYPRPFYRTRYPEGERGGTISDMRSTIHWSPNIITDTTGHATLSFFAADRPATYRVIVEGSDMNGALGYGEREIVVGKK